MVLADNPLHPGGVLSQQKSPVGTNIGEAFDFILLINQKNGFIQLFLQYPQWIDVFQAFE